MKTEETISLPVWQANEIGRLEAANKILRAKLRKVRREMSLQNAGLRSRNELRKMRGRQFAAILPA